MNFFRNSFGIKYRILFRILTATAIIFIISIVLISINNRKTSLNSAFDLVDEHSEKYANEVKLYLEEYMDVSRAITSIFEGKENYPPEMRRAIFMNVLKDVLKDNPHFLAAWTIWEPNAVDGMDSLFVLKPGCTHIGSFSATYYRSNENIYLEDSGTGGELFVGSYYTIPKANKQESLLNPFYYSYTGNPEDEILQTNMIVPIVINNEFHGVVGVDAALDSFHEIIRNIKPFNDGYAFIIANDGSYIAHPDEDLIGESYNDHQEQVEKQFHVLKTIQDGKSLSFSYANGQLDEKYYYSFTPVFVGNTTTPWSLAVVVPYKSILADINRNILFLTLIAITGLILLAVLLNFISNGISKPLTLVSKEIKKLNSANLDKLTYIEKTENNEIGEIARSSFQLIDWINKTGQFAHEIGDEHYDYNYELYNDHDLLGQSLIDLRKRLIQAHEESEKRNIENERRNWAAEGISELNEVVRSNNEDIHDLYYILLSTLIQYVKAVQGGIFIIEDDGGDQVLDLKASYAFDRRKFIQKKMHYQEGLVGRCVMERKRIILTEIPENYISITSGLGKANPTNLLLVPLIFNENVFGVIELASLKPFENYIIDFIEKAAETIASSVSIIKTNVQTTELLEKSKHQAEELEAREKELQQNLEELKSVHEQLDNNNKQIELREKNVIAILDGIPDAILTCSDNGEIIDFNPEFLMCSGYEKPDLENQQINILLDVEDLTKLKLRRVLSLKLTRKDGKIKNIEAKVTKIQKQEGTNYLFLIRSK